MEFWYHDYLPILLNVQTDGFRAKSETDFNLDSIVCVIYTNSQCNNGLNFDLTISAGTERNVLHVKLKSVKHNKNNKKNLSEPQYCICCRDCNSITASHCNTDAVENE